MLTVVFDAAPLITACKFVAHSTLVIAHLLAGCRIMITPSIEEEVAVLGASYPDGEVDGERIAQGRIQVVPVVEQRWARHLAEYALGDGERDTIELCGQTAGIEALVTDDYLAFAAATRQGLKAWMLPDLVVELAARGALAIEVAESVLTAMQSRYRAGVIEQSRVRLQEIKQHAESCGACEGGNTAGCGASQGSGSE